MAKVPFTLRIEEDLLKKIKRDALEHEISISSEIELRIIESIALQLFQSSLDDKNTIKELLNNELMKWINRIRNKYIIF